MPTLDEIRKKKLQELMQAQQQKSQHQYDEQLQLQQQVEQMESVVRQYLSKDALVRYGNIKAAHNEKALQLVALLFQLIQNGQLKSVIDDKIMKKLLLQLEPKKRDIQIRRV